ncbi:KpsF/GutQ family sugar-phosphate isomerase [Lutibacter citreus]|uniref:KpsF/GutQ family sugar-phosphate isomerase n=1 Tax=Lutibacter citreus TaxID=2138210 RepID=UPI000DBE1AEB|nr:KpsF/GutQ family sugar-phosphate isomerase [Lutibacter citreus]
MKNKNTIIDIAKLTIIEESKAIANLINFVNEDFTKTVNYILSSKGRVIVTGIGKSANIATKIVATFNSTGTPAIFMHAADAIHGDLGNIQKNDVVICISNSGNTPEIKVLVPLIKNYGNKIVAITGNTSSFLGTNCDFVLSSHVEKEACPNNLAPTSSTTAQLVIGDALAVCLLELNNFSSKDFAKYHPGGALGKKLYLRVRDLISNENLPSVELNTPIKDVIIEISKKRLGTTAVLNNDKIVGIITDGDLRRMLKDNLDISKLVAKDIMGANPKTISVEAMAIQALEAMENNNITQILVEDNLKYVGVVHLHDLLKEGII